MLSKSDMQALLDRMAHAYSVGDSGGCADFFADNAQLHSPFAAPAIGRAAIEVLHVDWTSESSQKSFTILDCGSADALAWCLCRFAEGAATGQGTSLVVWERTAAGTWLIRSCCLYGDLD